MDPSKDDIATQVMLAMMEAATEPKSQHASTQIQEKSAQILSDKNALVDEDDEIIQTITDELLTAENAKVMIASDGPKAFTEMRPDIVITNIMMPEMDGFELTAHLRKANYSGPIIEVTAAEIGDKAERLLTAGADLVLPKPINLEILKSWLADHSC